MTEVIEIEGAIIRGASLAWSRRIAFGGIEPSGVGHEGALRGSNDQGALEHLRLGGSA
jgi:hypothetical protein